MLYGIPYTFEWFSSLVRPLLVQKIVTKLPNQKSPKWFLFLPLSSDRLPQYWVNLSQWYSQSYSEQCMTHAPSKFGLTQDTIFLNEYAIVTPCSTNIDLWPLITWNVITQDCWIRNYDLWVGRMSCEQVTERLMDLEQLSLSPATYMQYFFSGHLGQNSPWIWNFLPKDRYR